MSGFYDETEVLQVFMWSCMRCGRTSLPLIFGAYADADKAIIAHWEEHALPA